MSDIDRQRRYYINHRAERQAYQRAYASAHRTLRDPALTLTWKAQRLTQRLADQQAEYEANQQACMLYAFGDAMPRGQYVGHCRIWQEIAELPHICTVCKTRLFEEETPRAC